MPIGLQERFEPLGIVGHPIVRAHLHQNVGGAEAQHLVLDVRVRPGDVGQMVQGDIGLDGLVALQPADDPGIEDALVVAYPVLQPALHDHVHANGVPDHAVADQPVVLHYLALHFPDHVLKLIVGDLGQIPDVELLRPFHVPPGPTLVGLVRPQYVAVPIQDGRPEHGQHSLPSAEIGVDDALVVPLREVVQQLLGAGELGIVHQHALQHLGVEVHMALVYLEQGLVGQLLVAHYRAALPVDILGQPRAEQ